MQRGDRGAQDSPLPATGRQHLLAVLILALLGLVGYGQLLIPGQLPFSPDSDIVTYHLGTKEVLARSLAAGRGIPFWRGDQLAGTPALTNPNTLYTYPLHLLFFFLSPAAAMGWTVWLHLLLGGCVYYLVGLQLGLGWWPRLFMGVAALFSFKLVMAVYAGWLSSLPAVVLFPLLVISVLRVVRRPGWTTGLLLTLVGALCLHGGYVQLVYYTGGGLLLWLVPTGLRAWLAGRGGEVLRLAGLLGVCAILAVGASAYLWIPMLAEAPLTSRVTLATSRPVYGHTLAPRHLLTLLSPEILGTPERYPGGQLWEDVAYFGLIPLGLALAGALLGRRRPYAGLLAAGGAVSLLLALHTPLTEAAYAFLPGFRYFRNPSRLLFLTSFFGVALAGVGLQELLGRLPPRRRGGLPWIGLLAGALTLLVAAEGVTYARRYVTTVPVSAVLPRGDFLEALRQDPALFRVAPLGGRTLNYGLAAPLGLQLIAGYEPYNLEHYGNYVQLMVFGSPAPRPGVVASVVLEAVTRWDLLDALNVRYLLTSRPLTLPAGRFEAVARGVEPAGEASGRGGRSGGVLVYRNREALERASWPEAVMAARTEPEALSLVQRHDVRRVAVVEGWEGGTPPSPALPGDRVSAAEWADGLLVLETHSRRGGFLRISEVWHPGWRAWIAGEELPLYRTSAALMGAWIPAGTHRVRLEFRPRWWRESLGISAVAWAGILGWLLAAMRHRRRGR